MKGHAGCSGSGCKVCACLEKCGQKCDNVCPVIRAVGCEIIFVKNPRIENCPFETHFGDSVVCTCPVRKANYFV